MAIVSAHPNPFLPAIYRPPTPILKPLRISSISAAKSETCGPDWDDKEEETRSLTVNDRRSEIGGLVHAERQTRDRREEVNGKIASRKAISIILRREATKAFIETKRGPNNSKKLLPRTVLEALKHSLRESLLCVGNLLLRTDWNFEISSCFSFLYI
ncbi:hypothetical protein F3Y22_tig00111621pilonHSYRG00432 [Hibiscus syriacus]|uniref:Uncharacterized protein n=1 Tax=Hibiscus syriacus TaxID=106335 RepID=A0A6A2YCX0_HIBSY|nr:hypothetical protein F3Y22_tig00111621pilonHSYRG00432 [Hibiscus syriacus]